MKKTVLFLTSGVIAIAVGTQLVLSYQNRFGEFEYPIARVFNSLNYFTIMSNILVGVISFLYARTPERRTQLRDIVQLSALVCICVTGIIYHLLLAGEIDVTGLAVVTDFVFHTLIPLAYVAIWFFILPHGRATSPVFVRALLIPIGWAAYALVRGAIIHYYPYPFMDVNYLGYVTALLNMAVITIFFLILFAFAYFLDKKALHVRN